MLCVILTEENFRSTFASQDRIKEHIKQQARQLEVKYPSAAASLLESLYEMFTVNQMGMPKDLVLPEHNVEGFGFVFFEALTHNVPVIGCNSGGIPDVIINNKTGLLVNPMDEAEIADTIIKL